MSVEITKSIASFVADFDDEFLSNESIESAKILVLDGLGCLIAGAGHPVSRIFVDYAELVGGRPECIVVGTDQKSSAPLAAFVNGCMLHVNDFEIQGAVPTHGTSNLLPPALGLTERDGCTGLAFLSAIVLGWEVQARFRHFANRNLNGFHYPGVFGCLGAATTSGRLLRLDTDEMRMAYGIVGSKAGGLFANIGTMAKSTHPGHAARMGVEAAMLAKLGLKSHPEIFETPLGFNNAFFRGEIDEVALLDGMKKATFIADPGFNIKRYPAEIYMQTIIEAVANVEQRRNINIADVDRIELELTAVRDDLSRPTPSSGLEGKFSYEYCAAVALSEPIVGIGSFNNEIRFSPDIESLLPKVKLIENPELRDAAGTGKAVANVVLNDGRVLSGHCTAYRGSIQNPMSEIERIQKFERCVAPYLDESSSDALIEAVANLDKSPHCDEIIHILGSIKIPTN